MSPEKASRPSGFRLWATLSYPIAWSILVLVLAGELGSPRNTLSLSYWLLSWFVFPSPDMLYTFHFILRKSCHPLLYGILFVLWFRAFRWDLAWPPSRATLVALALCLALALLDENWQGRHPFRHASWGDVLLDFSGAGAAAFLSWLTWRNADGNGKREMAPHDS